VALGPLTPAAPPGRGGFDARRGLSTTPAERTTIELAMPQPRRGACAKDGEALHAP